jgi:hypothetical protein
MKKILFLFCISFSFLFTSCDKSKQELYQKTDTFVESLQTTYESYGLNGLKHAVTTSDDLYTIMPIGRLINVKIKNYVTDEEYEKLKKNLEKHYKNDSRVNDVYICGGGTVMIDCRN